jgi:hypothetical protein
LRAALGPDTWVALATGSAGDISTRHMRRAQDFRELERLGAVLAEQAASLAAAARPIRILPPVVRAQNVALALKPPLSAENAAAVRTMLISRHAELLRTGQIAEARTVETRLQGLAFGDRAPAATAARLLAPVAVAQLGELGVVALPGEPYHRLGVDIRQAGLGPVLVLGYTNGYIGYIPTRDAYASLDYEILVSPLAPGAGERLRDTASDLLAKCTGVST